MVRILPIRGTASLVIGINSDTMFMNTVKDNITVTPGKKHLFEWAGNGYLIGYTNMSL